MNIELLQSRFTNAINRRSDYHIVVTDDTNIVRVGKKTGDGDSYVVNLSTMDCPCKDHEMRGEHTPCFHLIMAFLYLHDLKNIRD